MVVPDRLRCALKGAYHVIDLVPVALDCFHHQEHQVRACREVLPLVADDKALEVRIDIFERSEEKGNDVASDGIHLRVKLQTGHTITKIAQRRAGILPDHALLF